MSPQEYGQVLWRELQGRLRAAIQPRLPGRAIHFDVQDVLQLCYRQLQREEFAEPWLERAAAELPEDPWALQDCIAEVVNALAERVVSEPYVEDCVQVARLLAARSEAEQKAICDRYRPACENWIYGEGEQRRKGGGGVLAARLLAYPDKQKSENRFAKAKGELDAKVFTAGAFTECAREYRPNSGVTFQDFLRRGIVRRAADVARRISRRGSTKTTRRPDLDSLLPPAPECQEQEGLQSWQTAYRERLERFRQSQRDTILANRKIAAVELRYKSYLDPGEMTAATRELVASCLGHLRQEFRDAQQRLQELEDALERAQAAQLVALQAKEASRRALAAEGASPDELERLEREALVRTGTEMREELAALGPDRRNRNDARKMKHRILCKDMALARGVVEARRMAWEKWNQCRPPWVRTPEEIAQLLGESPASISRYLNELRGFSDE